MTLGTIPEQIADVQSTADPAGSWNRKRSDDLVLLPPCQRVGRVGGDGVATEGATDR